MAMIVPPNAASAAVVAENPAFVVIEAGNEPESGIPADWEDPDAVGPEGEDLPDEPSSEFAPGDPDCRGQWVYNRKKKFSDRMGRVGPSISHFFDSKGSHKLTAGINGEISATYSASVAGEATVVIATLTTQVDASIQAKIGVSSSMEVSVDVPAKRWGNAYWGRNRHVVTGEKYQIAHRTCKKTNRKLFTTYVSARSKSIGWCTWASKKSLGSRPTQCNDGRPYLKA
ncbi:hypothetical protein GCM10010124_39660 [Pilimelia terevasa]|uniref:Uncharacterized protein n=1 Tax=Pilimelia terevasa TaxID=53372 RepID=A0A8J3BQX0_9ACTN|nr:hypothetical protein [Pilimelia terevasa]GGK42887.1 hypothetical protein GCM10010124_39660 [Pilimelia terevasa]